MSTGKNTIIYRSLSLIWLILLPFISEAQKAEIMLVKHSPERIPEVFIANNEMSTLMSAELSGHSDTLYIHLDYNEKYTLHLSDYEPRRTGEPLLSLYLNGIPIIVVHSDISAGDHSWSFYTGIDKPALRIVGGTSVSIEDYPWQVFINAGDYLCGGTIIADKWVLTAAHCLFDEENIQIPDSVISFLAGAEFPFNFSPDGEKYEVDLSVIHEDYDPESFGNDMALLRTNKVIEHEIARPLNLITEEEVNAGLTDPGSEAIITGWGLTSVDPAEFPSRLQKLNLPIVSNEIGRAVWGPLPDNVLIAGYINGEGDACGGDSGGPLIVQSGNEYKLAGITSWGSSNCNSVGGYLKVSAFLEWLRKNTGVGQDQFRTIRPRGGDFRCHNSPPMSETRNYVSDELTAATGYEWRLEPQSAGSITYTDTLAQVEWANDFIGEAYVSARAITPEGYTNWAGQRVETSPLTQVTSQTGDTSVCLNTGLSLYVNAVGSDLTYDWFLNGDLIRVEGDPVFIRQDAGLNYEGIYYCEITGICGTAVSEPIEVELMAHTNIISAPDNNINLSLGDNLELAIDAIGHELQYSWFKDGSSISEPPTESILLIENIKADGTGLYQVQVDGTCGTEVSEKIYVYVDPDIRQFPEGINIWPTLTTTGQVNIAVDDDRIFDVYIYNLKGVRLDTKTYCQYKAILDLGRYRPDIYIIEVRFENESKNYKIIKQ